MGGGRMDGYVGKSVVSGATVVTIIRVRIRVTRENTT